MNGADVYTHTAEGTLRNRLELVGPTKPKPTTGLRRRFRFFHANAGGWVGHSAETALQLARAEALLDEAEDADVADFGYVYDDDPYDAGDIGEDEARRLFADGAWTGPYGAVLRIGADVHGSLWGIVFGPQDTNDPYARVVRAELASEACEALAEALQDKQDLEVLAEAETVLRRRGPRYAYAAETVYAAGCAIGSKNRTLWETILEAGAA